MGKKAIVVGATSGIGCALTRLMLSHGYTVGAMGRRIDLLDALRIETSDKLLVRKVDVLSAEKAMETMESLIDEMDGVDIVVISAGTGFINPQLEWSKESETITTNVLGFSAVANVAFNHFIQQRRGCLVGISSIAALRGSGDSSAYNASKAFVSNYLEGLRLNVLKKRLPVTVMDVRPGFVDTAMAQGDGLFWVASPEKAAVQILGAIQHKKNHLYVTKRWRFIAWLMKSLPESIYKRL